MCLLAGVFHFATRSPSDPVTLWLTGEWHQWQSAPIPPEANVAWSEWMRVEGRAIAFEPTGTASPPFSVSLLLPLSHAILLTLFCSSEFGARGLRAESNVSGVKWGFFSEGRGGNVWVGLILSGLERKFKTWLYLNVIKWYCSAYNNPRHTSNIS